MCKGTSLSVLYFVNDESWERKSSCDACAYIYIYIFI